MPLRWVMLPPAANVRSAPVTSPSGDSTSNVTDTSPARVGVADDVKVAGEVVALVQSTIRRGECEGDDAGAGVVRESGAA